MPDPTKDGRMPLNLQVAGNIVKVLGREIPIRGALSGPFSLAAHLAGPGHLFLLLFTHPGLVKDLVRFASEVIKRYGHAFIELGCGIVIFDSQASPALLSPELYQEFVLGPTREVIEHFHRLGVLHVPLIIGGNTTKIIDAYLETGANNILCDVKADAQEFLAKCSAARRAFRRNIDSTDFLSIASEDVHGRALKYLQEANGYPGFILGTAVVPYGTPLSHLVAVREAIREFAHPT